MYNLQCTEKEVDGETQMLYGITDGCGFFFDFTTDREDAKAFVSFLNENKVELCHIPEVIEDFFYSCKE